MITIRPLGTKEYQGVFCIHILHFYFFAEVVELVYTLVLETSAFGIESSSLSLGTYGRVVKQVNTGGLKSPASACKFNSCHAYHAGIAQLIRASGFHPEGRGFDSPYLLHLGFDI